MDINDQVIEAIQTYAAALPNPDFRLNLLAAAEDMAPKLITALGLKQEWAVAGSSQDATGAEVIDDIDDESENRSVVADRLERANDYDQREDALHGKAGNYRRFIATRIYTEWAEEVEMVLTPEEQHQMDIDQGVIPDPQRV